jgi:Zn-dependent protease with chaperone function
MNFFDYQDRARRWTRLLVGLYLLAVVLIVLAVYAAALVALSQAPVHRQTRASWDGGLPLATTPGLWQPEVFCWTTGLTLLILLGGTAYKIAELSGGGAVVARLLGGTPVPLQPSDPGEQRLRNVVEEMSIAAGLPVPELFVLPGENGINAFAAGLTSRDAAIAVTRGALRVLTRDELQGVVAHEFSHILNADMRLNVRLMGVLHGILMIALTGYTVMRIMGRSTGRRSGKSGGIILLLFLLGLAVMVIGYIGVFFANLIKAAIGREREFLADASAVQFTRNPTGLAGALKKIAAWQDGGQVAADGAAAASHFFIAEPGVHTWMNFLDTHPPLEERIRRLDPSFTGNLADVQRELAAARVQQRPYEPATDLRRPMPTTAPRAAVSGLAARVGTADFQSVAYAAALLEGIPADCRRAAATVEGAESLVYALVLSPRPEVRQKQMAHLASHAASNVYTRLVHFQTLCSAMPEASRLPLADLAISALRGLPADRYPGFRSNLMSVVLADEVVDVFEFAMLHMVARQLDRHFRLSAPPRVRFGSLSGLEASVACVFGLVVWNGCRYDDDAEKAYAAGWAALGEPPAAPLRDRRAGTIRELEGHLDRLAEAAPQVKAQVLAACAAVAATDGRTTLHEAETLRAIADALDCPVPPFAPEQAA